MAREHRETLAERELEHTPFNVPAWAWLTAALALAGLIWVGVSSGQAWIAALALAVTLALVVFLAATTAREMRERRRG